MTLSGEANVEKLKSGSLTAESRTAVSGAREGGQMVAAVQGLQVPGTLPSLLPAQ